MRFCALFPSLAKGGKSERERNDHFHTTIGRGARTCGVEGEDPKLERQRCAN